MRYEVSESELAAIEVINADHFDRVWVKLTSGEGTWAFIAR